MNTSTPPQILFVERCLNLLEPGGILGAILPESLVSSKSHGYVVQYLQKDAELISVVGMPEALFKTSGKGGTHTKTVAVVLQKKPVKNKRSTVFFLRMPSGADTIAVGVQSHSTMFPIS